MTMQTTPAGKLKIWLGRNEMGGHCWEYIS